MLVTTTTIGVNQLQYLNLLALVLGTDTALRYRAVAMLIFRNEQKLLTDRFVGCVDGDAFVGSWELIKIITPLFRYLTRILKIGFIELFYVSNVTTR